MTTPSSTSIDSLARSWDELVRGGTPDPSPGATDVSDLLRDLHRPDHDLDADPRFVSSLQRELLAAWQPMHAHLNQHPDPNASGQHSSVAPGSITHRRPWHRPASQHVSIFASAALLLLTLVSAMALLASAWQPAPEQGLRADVISAPIVHDPANTLGTLASFRVPELPPALGRLLMERWTYPPHSEAITTEKLTGPLLLYVIKGEVVVALTGGEAMLLGEDGSLINPLLSLDASTGRVSAGQALLLPAQTQMTTSNQGENEAILIAVTAYADSITDWTLPYQQTIIKQESLASALTMFPTGPVEITLQRSVLAAGESIPAPPAGAIQLVGSESELLAYLRRAPDGAVTNLENEPLHVLIATVATTE